VLWIRATDEFALIEAQTQVVVAVLCTRLLYRPLLGEDRGHRVQVGQYSSV